ncbi:hypothetical protein B0A64_13565 [Flavobacterium araucananum]|uniref:Transporter n=2 Tax=Flavobacterium araucananum TaxID=946678 RepID=A0A227P581_9FLAO|nr:hypothetical protein B0A64_13565 [Flavobacterium araucananum]
MLLMGSAAKAQSGNLDSYIQEAFKGNESLKQRFLELEKSLYALKEAKTLFLPTTNFGANYSLAKGGRSIELPLGDLMNPVYNTLNTLTQNDQFKNLSNTKVTLNPNNFYDVRLHTSMDLYNRETVINERIKQGQITLEKSKISIYKRELVKEVKTAWFEYQQLLEEKGNYQSDLEMINESLRINEALLKNGKIYPTLVLRSQTYKKGIENSIIALQARIINAQAYFNFLLNKPFDSAIIVAQWPSEPLVSAVSEMEDSKPSEELDAARTSSLISGLQNKMDRSAMLPRVSTFIDLGLQDFAWKVKDGSPYYIAGVNMKWELFAFGRNRYKTAQSSLGMQQAESQYQLTGQRIALEEKQAENLCQTASKNYNNTLYQVELAEQYYADQLKIYKQGRLLYIELLDAQTQLTQIRVRRSIDYMGYQIAYAALERLKALYKID